MVKRTVHHLFYSYATTLKDEAGRDVATVLTGQRGDTIELSEAEARRGDALGAFTPDGPGGGELPPDGPSFNAMGATDEDLDSFVTGANAPEVVEAAGDSPAAAERLLDAEERVRQGNPRKSVMGPLEDVIAQAQR